MLSLSLASRNLVRTFVPKQPIRLMSKKVAVVLSGCGVFDGSEIHEATSVLIHLSKAKADVDVFAPNIEQDHVTDHSTKNQVKETRNCLVESARISRGKIADLKKLKANDYHALFFPGGFGAATNLCNFASAGAHCKVNADVERVIKDFHDGKKPIGLCCIAPVLAARVIKGVHVTIGTDKGTAETINKMGACHEDCQITEVCVDQKNHVVTAPAYMCGSATVADVYENVGLMVEKCPKSETLWSKESVWTVNAADEHEDGDIPVAD